MKQSKLRKAIYKGKVKAINRMLNKGISIDENSRTALLELTACHKWGWSCSSEMIKYLIDSGADVNYTVARETATTGKLVYEFPLSNAVDGSNVELVKILLDHGAIPNKNVDNSHPPNREWPMKLHETLTEGLLDSKGLRIRSLLIEHGAEES